ncbi:Protein PGR [Vitis vinifera]|uniref:Protein PGR n=1 Tax=Vitis vinifera TaxID=29760 RepID=A0A438JQ43_VITVI|nr:Protein PGR [Vitis vinifera]
MENFPIQPIIAILFSAAIAIRSFRRKSLDLSGAFAGFAVLTIHFGVGYRYGAMLLAFFLTSSKLTKFGEEKKRLVDADFKEASSCVHPPFTGLLNLLVCPQHWLLEASMVLKAELLDAAHLPKPEAGLNEFNKTLAYIDNILQHLTLAWKQVLFNSGISAVLALILWRLTGWQDKCLDSKESSLITSLIGGIIGHYSCCNGDTWSSELGILSDSQPRLITTFKPVRKGTNGGVTKTGLLAATAAGGVIGLTFVLIGFFTTKCASDVALKQLLVIPLSAVAGLCGSLIDSLLGATLQYSGFCSVRNKVVGKPGPTVRKISGISILDNNGVNLVSILLTSMLTSIACLYIF